MECGSWLPLLDWERFPESKAVPTRRHTPKRQRFHVQSRPCPDHAGFNTQNPVPPVHPVPKATVLPQFVAPMKNSSLSPCFPFCILHLPSRPVKPVKPSQTMFSTLTNLTLNTHPFWSAPALNPVHPKFAGFSVRGNSPKFADSSYFAFPVLGRPCGGGCICLPVRSNRSNPVKPCFQP